MNMNNNSEDYDDMDNERSFNKSYTHIRCPHIRGV